MLWRRLSARDYICRVSLPVRFTSRGRATRLKGHMPTAATEPQAIYWHRQLPPLDAQPMDEHVVEASSTRLADTIAHRDELWNRCEDELMANAGARLRQEIVRLGGRCAHVVSESIETRHDAASGETWLHGCFRYMLYR